MDNSEKSKLVEEGKTHDGEEDIRPNASKNYDKLEISLKRKLKKVLGSNDDADTNLLQMCKKLCKPLEELTDFEENIKHEISKIFNFKDNENLQPTALFEYFSLELKEKLPNIKDEINLPEMFEEPTTGFELEAGLKMEEIFDSSDVTNEQIVEMCKDINSPEEFH